MILYLKDQCLRLLNHPITLLIILHHIQGLLEELPQYTQFIQVLNYLLMTDSIQEQVNNICSECAASTSSVSASDALSADFLSSYKRPNMI